jgi:hypothetical protein
MRPDRDSACGIQSRDQPNPAGHGHRERRASRGIEPLDGSRPSSQPFIESETASLSGLIHELNPKAD